MIAQYTSADKPLAFAQPRQHPVICSPDVVIKLPFISVPPLSSDGALWQFGHWGQALFDERPPHRRRR